MGDAYDTTIVGTTEAISLTPVRSVNVEVANCGPAPYAPRVSRTFAASASGDIGFAINAMPGASMP
jgi:hypothetical protein